MKQDRISQTALKVALGLITLNIKDDWAKRLPVGLVEMSECLLIASGSPGYGPRMMEWSKQPWMLRAYGMQEWLLPGQFEGFGYRKIFVQQQVEAAIEQGVRQVLIVGAGFDTLCLRLAPQYPDLHFLEVDHPATSAAKRKGIEQVGRPANLTQVAADLGERPLSQVLEAEEHWRTDVLSVLVAEGLFQYLTDEEVRGLLVEAAVSTGTGSRFVFTHALPGYSKWVTILTNLISESWKSSVHSEDLQEYIEGTGWTMISEVDSDSTHGAERYAVVEQR